MSDEEMKAELERLRNEKAAFKKGAATGITMKVSEKGGLSAYGMGERGGVKDEGLGVYPFHSYYRSVRTRYC
jgi:hypothetical protein